MSDEREPAIRQRAYAIWEQEGRPDGKSLAHWLQAETEIRAEKIVAVADNSKRSKSSQIKVAVSRRRRP
jgi:hypothetical protein